jgi:PAS domain S-box-containing protein
VIDDPSDVGAELRRLIGPVLGALGGLARAVHVADARRPDQPVLFLNAAWTRLTGFEADDALGRDPRRLLAMDGAAAAALSAAMREGRSHEAGLLVRRRDGTKLRSRVLAAPIADEAGQPAFSLVLLEEAAEAAAQAREDRQEDDNESLRATLAASGIMASWSWDLAARHIMGDARFAALYGLEAEQAAAGVPAATFFSIIHPQDLPRIRLAVGGLLHGAEIFSKEYRVALADGAKRWVHARGRCIRDAAHPEGRFVGTLVDITDQKRVEERLRVAQSAGGIGTFEYVAGYGTVAVSPQFCRLLGLQPSADLPLRTINGVVQSGDPPVIEPGVLDPSGMAGHAEFRITRPDTGEVRWLARRGETLRDIDTAEALFSGVIYDVTESKRTEGKLRSLNDELEARVAERTAERNGMWRLSAEVMLVARLDGAIAAVNPAWSTVLGWQEEELVGRSVFALIHPDDVRAARDAIASLSKGTPLSRFVIRCRGRDGGHRWISWSAAVGEDRINAVGRDVTAEREQAEALDRAEEQLRQSQKMEAIGQLTGGLAHDVNNMLQGIRSALEMVEKRMETGRLADVPRLLLAGREGVDRAAALTHGLLAFARRGQLDARPTVVGEVVRGLADLVHRTVGPAIEVRLELGAGGSEDGDWTVQLDRNSLESALLNLAINARDAMPDGGCLTFATRELGPVAADLEMGNAPAGPGEFVLVSVSDTGNGMPPDVVERAFEPFFTTKPIGQGTGLGLSQIYGFVQQSGGTVRITSEVGRGTTVNLYFPRAVAAAQAETVALQTGTRQDGTAGRTVLLVEDEPAVRATAAELLRECGYVVLEAADGPSGLAVLTAATRLDLLVTDVGLPGLNGRQLADAARVRRPTLPVLFITGYAGEALNDALPPGMAVIAKPFPLDLLATRVAAMLTMFPSEAPEPSHSRLARH